MELCWFYIWMMAATGTYISAREKEQPGAGQEEPAGSSIPFTGNLMDSFHLTEKLSIFQATGPAERANSIYGQQPRIMMVPGSSQLTWAIRSTHHMMRILLFLILTLESYYSVLKDI